MEDEKLLKSATKWQRRYNFSVGQLGKILDGYIQYKIKPHEKNSSPILDAWKKVLPPGLETHCKVESIKNKILTVKVDSPAFKFQLESCRMHLLEALKQEDKKVKITKIVFKLG